MIVFEQDTFCDIPVLFRAYFPLYSHSFTKLDFFFDFILLIAKKAVHLRSNLLDVAQLVAHLVRDQEVAGSSPVIQTRKREANWLPSFSFCLP